MALFLLAFFCQPILIFLERLGIDIKQCGVGFWHRVLENVQGREILYVYSPVQYRLWNCGRNYIGVSK